MKYRMTCTSEELALFVALCGYPDIAMSAAAPLAERQGSRPNEDEALRSI